MKVPAETSFFCENLSFFTLFMTPSEALVNGVRCSERVGDHLFPAWSPFAQSPWFVSAVMSMLAAEWIWDFGVNALVVLFLSLGKILKYEHTGSLLFVTYVFQNSSSPVFSPQWQSFSNAKFYLAHSCLPCSCPLSHLSTAMHRLTHPSAPVHSVVLLSKIRRQQGWGFCQTEPD